MLPQQGGVPTEADVRAVMKRRGFAINERLRHRGLEGHDGANMRIAILMIRACWRGVIGCGDETFPDRLFPRMPRRGLTQQ
jgi:hypothetical protein